MFRHGSKVPSIPIAAALAILTGCARGEVVAPDGVAADFAALAADFAAAASDSAALQDHARGMAHRVAHQDHAAAIAEGLTHHEHVQHGEHVQRGHMGRHPAGHTALGAEDRPPHGMMHREGPAGDHGMHRRRPEGGHATGRRAGG